LQQEVDSLREKASAQDLWDDPENASKVTSALSRSQDKLDLLKSVESRIDDLEVLIEMANHLPQLSVLGPQLTRMGWVLDVHDITPWWVSACMVLMGTGLHLWLRPPQDAQRAKEPQP
jgi:hypothetical protein